MVDAEIAAVLDDAAFIQSVPETVIEPVDTVITHGPFYLTQKGVIESREPTFEEWEACFSWAQDAERSIQFWLGDLLEIGERKFGDKYTQALEATEYAEQTLKNFTYVARKVPMERRQPTDKVSFSHHEVVAPLTPDEQTTYLQRARDESLSRDTLRAVVKEDKALASGKSVEFWLVVRCASAQDQLELSERLRLEGRAVKLR